jgi:nicotinamidase-related amidase
LIIDVQIGLVELVPPEVQSSILPKIKTLLPKARASEIAVIFIQHDGPQGHPLETHTKGWGIHPSLDPVGGGPIVRKRESDSFFETELQGELGKRGGTNLIVAGGMNRVLCGHHLPTCYQSRR